MEQITLIENDGIIYNAKDVSEVLNTFFSNDAKVLNIQSNNAIINDIITESDPILIAIERYKFHPSILKINEKFCKEGDFVFSEINSNDVYNEIFKLKNKVSSPNDSFPLKIIRNNLHLFVSKLHFDINFSINHCTFPHNLKCADITPVIIYCRNINVDFVRDIVRNTAL